MHPLRGSVAILALADHLIEPSALLQPFAREPLELEKSAVLRHQVGGPPYAVCGGGCASDSRVQPEPSVPACNLKRRGAVQLVCTLDSPCFAQGVEEAADELFYVLLVQLCGRVVDLQFFG